MLVRNLTDLDPLVLVLDLIGACLRHAHRKKSLRAGVLVCKRWREALQPHIFYKITLSFTDEVEKWASFTGLFPHIAANCVRKVVFKPTDRADDPLASLTPEITKDQALFEKWMAARGSKKRERDIPLDPPTASFPIMPSVQKLSYTAGYVDSVLISTPQVIRYLSHFPNLQSVKMTFQFATVNDAEQFFATCPPLRRLKLVEVSVASVRSKRISSKSKCDFSRLETLHCSHMREDADWIVDLLTSRPRQGPKNLKELVIEDCLSIDAIEKLVQISSASLELLWISHNTDNRKPRFLIICVRNVN